MDLHSTPSHAPVRDAELHSIVADPVERSSTITFEEQITELWGHINAATARFLELVGVVEGAKGEPLAVGRRTRAVPPAIRRALRVRDGGYDIAIDTLCRKAGYT